MHLPTPQFTRLATAVSSNLNNPALESMVLAWDHVSIRYLNRIKSNQTVVGRIQSIRQLAVHDAVQAVLDPGYGYVFNKGSSLHAALAAVAKASHDILAGVFPDPSDQSDLDHSLQESLSLIRDGKEKTAGTHTGEESAAAYTRIFGPLALDIQLEKVLATENTHRPFAQAARKYDELGRYSSNATRPPAWRRSA